MNNFKKQIQDLLDNPGLNNLTKNSPFISFFRKNNTYEHNLKVSELSYKLAKKFNANENICARAGFLHDCWLDKFKNSPLYKITHYKDSVIIAQRLKESDLVILAIKTHMFPFGPMPKNKESFIVCLADKIISFKEFIS